MSDHARWPETGSRGSGRHRAPRQRARRILRRLGVSVVAAVTLGLGVTAVLALRHGTQESDSSPAGDNPATVVSEAQRETASSQRPPASGTQPLRAAVERIPEEGPGTFRIAPAVETAEVSGATTYRVEVEHGLPFDSSSTARLVDLTLTDPRGWTASPEHRLVRVDERSDLRIILATPRTADTLCAPLDTKGRLSCRNGPLVVLNAWRWRHGGPGYRSNITDYRRYLINHETGHALGYPHTPCPGEDRLAPVMHQQTIGLDGCRPNPWPANVDLRPGKH